MSVELLMDPSTWVALLTLTSLEIILGIDNIVFIAILADRLPVAQQRLAYRLGLAAALLSRLALLGTINWVMQLTQPWFSLAGHEISGRSLILMLGGIFLVGKSTHEMYAKVEGVDEEERAGGGGGATLVGTVFQIMLLDIVFSLDSVITAVGMAQHFEVMAAAIVIAVIIMLAFAQKVGDFVNKNPSMQILALSFLLLIGVMLTAESLGQHMNKGYIYSAMGFALLVELINMRIRKNSKARQAAEAEMRIPQT